MEETQGMKEGVVTLLDILGWKGIWQRKSDAIEALVRLITLSNNKALLFSDGKKHTKKANAFKDLKVEIKSISDTIALITYGESNLCLEFHSMLTSVIVPKSIIEGIPVRGATSYGLLSTKDNIMVGPAIDEVATWYEAANWIGVILTPSALFKLKIEDFMFDQNRLIEHEVSIKNYGKYKTFCTNWIGVWNHNKRGKDELLEKFLEFMPISPDVYMKLSNTVYFYDIVKGTPPKQESEVAVTSEK